MIENTLMSLMSIMALVWVATQFVKTFWSAAPQNLIALLLGEAVTMVFWKAGIVTLDGASHSEPWGWGVAAIYGLFAVSMAAKSHEVGKDPKKLIKKIHNGKTVE